ncbi:MAG: helicase-associated domain-containing protein [Anaerolineales bacterium]|nr:helicase-associated domain-containing protein [Anaerolineales bacterium]
MYSLKLSLQDEDLGRLKIIAELWGIELPEARASNALPHLLEAMLNPSLLLEIVSSLPPDASCALNELLGENRRVPYADYNRDYGPIREMGPGKRDREKPWRSAISPLEELWYRGLVARTFLAGKRGHVEYIVIPEDLADLLPVPSTTSSRLPGTPAAAPTHPIERSQNLIEDLVTLLAYLRVHPASTIDTVYEPLAPFITCPEAIPFLIALLLEVHILQSSPLRVDPNQVKAFLDLPGKEIQHRLARAWRTSTRWNDLAHVPGLAYPEDDWPNDPILSREGALSAIMAIPLGTWWELQSLVASVKEDRPSFQRPAGDFDSWYIRRQGTDQFLRGFIHWDNVEGGLLRFILTGPLYWLGLIEISGDFQLEDSHAAFRLLDSARMLDETEPITANDPQPTSAIIKSSGEIIAPIGMQPHNRYQLARCARWESFDRRGYRYQLTPASLQAASEQGLETQHLLAILTMAGDGPLAPALSHAIKRWALQGQEAGMEHVLIVRVSRSEILDELRKNKATSRFILERLGPTTAVVHENAWPKFIQAAAENRILIEPPRKKENSA